MTKKRTLKNHHDLRYLQDIPPAPDHFKDEAAAIWDRTCDILMDRFELTEGDLTLVETYSQTLHAHRCLAMAIGEEHVVMDRFGSMVTNPLHATLQKYAQQLNQITSLLGLNPKSRRDLKESDRKASGPSDYSGAF